MRLKKRLKKYDKIYASYLGLVNGEHAFKDTESTQVIISKHFTRSGSTSREVGKAWYAMVASLGYRKAIIAFGLMPVGTIVKLYLRENKWHYRHLGE